jgi:hypothetical protein
VGPRTPKSPKKSLVVAAQNSYLMFSYLISADYIHICQRSDPQANICINNSIEALRSKLAEGRWIVLSIQTFLFSQTDGQTGIFQKFIYLDWSRNVFWSSCTRNNRILLQIQFFIKRAIIVEFSSSLYFIFIPLALTKFPHLFINYKLPTLAQFPPLFQEFLNWMCQL